MAATTLLAVVLEGVLGKVISLAAEEISAVWGLESDLQKLAEKLEMVRALMLDAETIQASHQAVRLWLERLRVVASEADDVFEELTYEVLRRKIEIPTRKREKVRYIMSPINIYLFRRYMANKINKINSRLKDIYEDTKVMALRPREPMNINNNCKNERVTGPFVAERKIVGRDNDVANVVDMLINTENQERISVIGVVGMAGQGKTTLAQLVYNNHFVKNHFVHRIWICVSEEFNVMKLLNEMVQSLTKTSYTTDNKEAIIGKLQQLLSGKRFLLVLDDVWNKNRLKWECMKDDMLEIGGSRGTKMLITTRSDDVLSRMEPFERYGLGRLSDDDAWKLFKKIAFGEEGARESPDLVPIGERLVRRCGGLPLAIKTLGGLLYYREDEYEWLRIEQSEIWGASGVLPTIELSYENMPSLALKQCFAYCSIFPKDYVMEREILIQLWMAQGFLNPSSNGSYSEEDVGINYFNILLRSSLLQDPTFDDYNNVRSCKMHDLVHDFALRALVNHCLTLEVGDVNKVVKAVHCSLISSEEAMVKTTHGISAKVRTLYLSGLNLGNMVTKFKHLRVLILHDEKIKELPPSIGKLKHMRYLDISCTLVKRLPNSVTKLYNLQTLRLFELEEIPKKFTNLKNLRHIYIKHPHGYIFSGIGQLVCLRTLPYFLVSRVRGCLIEELGTLYNLKGNLIIHGLENVENGEESMKANLLEKSNIDNLELQWSLSRGGLNVEDVLEGLQPHPSLKGLSIVNFKGTRFPSWMVTQSNSFRLDKLVKIKLQNCRGFDQIPTLGHLDHLKILVIVDLRNVQRISAEFYGLQNLDRVSNIPTSIFPSLQKLTLDKMWNLEEWLGAEQGSISSTRQVFPCLEELIVRRCHKLTSLPDMEGFASLRHLSIDECETLNSLPEWIRNLEFLEKLEIRSCANLLSIPNMTSGLPSLRVLHIRSCDKLVALPRGLDMCMSLEDIMVVGSNALEVFDVLQPLSSLRSLQTGQLSEELDDFPWPQPSNRVTTVDEIDEYIQVDFVSLDSLTLFGWPKLTSLPNQLKCLTVGVTNQIF